MITKPAILFALIFMSAETLTPTKALVNEGDKYGANIVKSSLSPFLSKLAAEHAREVCNGATPHDGFLNRAKHAMQGQAGEISEIVSRSWPSQSVHDGGHDAWKSWRASQAHWRTANGKPKSYGASMIRDHKGRWVAVIIASWR